MRNSWTDRKILQALDLRDYGGLSSAEIGQRMGVSKGSVVGALHRVNTASDKEECRCNRRANRDGGMPRKWWVVA